MSFKKPFRAVPVKIGPYYHAKRRRAATMRWVMGLSLGVVVCLATMVSVRHLLPTRDQKALAAQPQIVSIKPGEPLHYDRGMSAAELDAQQPSAGEKTGIARSMPSVASAGSSWSYRNCRAARAAGAAPIYRGQPGYGLHMDDDQDGIACEPLPRGPGDLR